MAVRAISFSLVHPSAEVILSLNSALDVRGTVVGDKDAGERFVEALHTATG